MNASRSITLSLGLSALVVSAVSLAFSLPAIADQAPDPTVIVYRTLGDADLLEAGFCQRAFPECDVDPDCDPDEDLVPNASILNSLATRANNGSVVNSRVLGFGTKQVCTRIESFAVGAENQHYEELTFDDGLVLTLRGECEITDMVFDGPSFAGFMTTCWLLVTDAPPGIRAGHLTSNTIIGLNPDSFLGGEIGSYWTLQLFSEDGR